MNITTLRFAIVFFCFLFRSNRVLLRKRFEFADLELAFAGWACHSRNIDTSTCLVSASLNPVNRRICIMDRDNEVYREGVIGGVGFSLRANVVRMGETECFCGCRLDSGEFIVRMERISQD